MYIQELPEWPRFTWNQRQLLQPLADLRHRQGRLIGRMEALGFSLREQANLENLSLEVRKSGEIEGEKLPPDQVRSSIANRLGMDIGGLVPADRQVEGAVAMVLDATQRHGESLTKERLWEWHAGLFPEGKSGPYITATGCWRGRDKDPMQVVSGPIGREKIHFEAPAGARLEEEMAHFLHWFETTTDLDPILKAAIAHLRFLTIHPFEDGNGRIARAIADLQLARADETSQRFYSMSARIREERNAYYDILEQTPGEIWISPTGCSGFSPAWKNLFKWWNRLWQGYCSRPAFGKLIRKPFFSSGRGWYCRLCWMVMRASSRLRNGRHWLNAPQTRPCGISTI